MKVKKIMLITCLLLAILTIGAASASETTDDLAVNDISDDAIVESSVDSTDVISSDEDDYVDGEIYSEIYTNDEYNSIAEIYDDNYLNGTITLSIDNAQYFNKNVNEKRYSYDIEVYELNLPDALKTGSHNIVLTYLKNGVSTPYTWTKTSNFTYSPDISYDDVSIGETAYVLIEHLPGSSGTATIYNYNDTTGKIGTAIITATITNGEALIPISGLAKGTNSFYLNMTINNENYDGYFTIRAKENTAGFTSSINATQVIVGNDVVVTINGPKTKGMAYISVDGKTVKRVSLANGVISESISGLALGQHPINVYFSNSGRFYSNTFNVNVIQKPADVISLALKKATVKKSAKKLVLQATLKVNGKAANKKVVVFKFNGKTIKAKTNAKGIAKATVKKSILKKLKVGKKITYTAKYSTKTAKQTVKVKK